MLSQMLRELVASGGMKPQGAGGTEPPVDELDEAEIERSIREINEAIKRSSQKKP